MPSEPALVLRPSTPDDADALAELLLASRAAAHPAVPRSVHPPDDVRRWFRARFEDPAAEVWQAEEDGVPLGLLLLEHDWVHSLYVAPGRTGEGIGSALLELARTLRPRGLGLWVFASNPRAQRFYARHGFVEVRRTDGSGPDGNEEGAPDVEMAWPDPTSLPAMRARIDDLDDRLATLLEERAGLTAAVQALKAVPGHAGRDRGREQEIVARMAALAPTLGVDGMGRIMEAVISESLDATEQDGTTRGTGGLPSSDVG